MKSHIKLILLCSFIILLNLAFYIGKEVYKSQQNKIRSVLGSHEHNNLKHILFWTTELGFSLYEMGVGQEGFISRKCPHTNCFITTNMSYFDDYRKFDVIAFSATELAEFYYEELIMPTLRSPHQKYVLASIQSPDIYPLCNKNYNNFFNWTWTFKLDSEVQWGYIAIRDLHNNVIGPRKDMKWLNPSEMTPMSDEFKKRLTTKQIAVAWFVPSYNTNTKRRLFVEQLKKELNRLGCGNDVCTIDIYGKNEIYKCFRDMDEMCYNVIEDKYYFLLSFEDALSPDFVTETLLRALNNTVVPIVYGGADYSRFLPQESYLDARKLGVVKLARSMYDLIKRPDMYADYFRWKNHYIYQRPTEAADTHVNCKICELLNDERAMNAYSVYQNFTGWWNTPAHCISKDLTPGNQGNRSMFIAQLSHKLLLGKI